MDTGSKLSLGIVASAVLLLGGYVGYKEFDRARTVHELQAVADQFEAADSRVAFEVQRRQIEASGKKAAADRRYRVSHTLDDSQRCVGGTVIEVHGSRYVQLKGAGGRPVRCVGRMAAESIR